MGSVRVEKFGGMLPSWNDRFIPEDQAAFSQNTYLYSGAAIGWRNPALLRTMLNSAAKYAYRVPTLTSGTANANLVFTALPAAGDTVTIGEVTYTFRTVPAAAYDVLLGSGATSALKTAEALLMAVVYGAYDTAVVGVGTGANSAAAPAALVEIRRAHV